MYQLCSVLPKRILYPVQTTWTCQSELEVTLNPILHFHPFIGIVGQSSSESRGRTGQHCSQDVIYVMLRPNNTTSNQMPPQCTKWLR